MSSSLMKDYFFKPPINQFSLNFLDQELERSYRTSYQEEVRSYCDLAAQALFSWDTAFVFYRVTGKGRPTLIPHSQEAL